MDTLDTSEQLTVKREARALQSALRLFEHAAQTDGNARVISGTSLQTHVDNLERLIAKPEATPEAKAMLTGSLNLAEQVVHGIQKAAPKEKRRGWALFRRKVDTASLASQLLKELEQHRKTIEELRGGTTG